MVCSVVNEGLATGVLGTLSDRTTMVGVWADSISGPRSFSLGGSTGLEGASTKSSLLGLSAGEEIFAGATPCDADGAFERLALAVGEGFLSAFGFRLIFAWQCGHSTDVSSGLSSNENLCLHLEQTPDFFFGEFAAGM